MFYTQVHAILFLLYSVDHIHRLAASKEQFFKYPSYEEFAIFEYVPLRSRILYVELTVESVPFMWMQLSGMKFLVDIFAMKS